MNPIDEIDAVIADWEEGQFDEICIKSLRKVRDFLNNERLCPKCGTPDPVLQYKYEERDREGNVIIHGRLKHICRKCRNTWLKFD